MTDPDNLSPLEIIAILRHLRWGYARYALMWWIVGAGLVCLEPWVAARWGDTFVWICSWAAWGAVAWGTMAFATAMFHSDKWLLGNFIQQTSQKPPLSEDEPAPTGLNQRLDEMGPHYRAIFGRLTRVLAIIENASSKKPPGMTSGQFNTVIENLESSAAWLREAAKDIPLNHTWAAHGEERFVCEKFNRRNYLSRVRY